MADNEGVLAIIDNFELLTPTQQILDRFLMGYPFAGQFFTPGTLQVFFSYAFVSG